MNAYEEKRQRRIESYKEQAEKAEQESKQLAQESSKMIDAIPMGQPLLVDHYSYKSDKNYRDRAWNKMGKSVEASKKAEYYRNKAKAAENNAAISSDDPDAIEKLQEKLQSCQDFQDHMKKANAYYRKYGTMKGFEEISDETAANMGEAIKNGYSWEKAPYPSYRLSNNNAEINRLKKRIASLECRDETGFVGWKFEGGEAVANTEENRLQLLFDEKPNEEQRSKLKRWGFRWSPSNKAWQRQLNNNAIYAAGQLGFIQPLDGRTPRELQPKPKNRSDKMGNNSNIQSDQWYTEIFEKPLEEIKQDVFFRSDNFENEDWYDDFLLFTGIGICSPAPKNILNVQKALKIMGYETHVKAIKNEFCIVSDKANEKQKTTPNRMEQ